ncbi:hypothetical protein RsS62_24450 [Rhizobium dioscoreae]|nr:hypothetical protein RsS62_24450 [Rhizobium dioscoreae]
MILQFQGMIAEYEWAQILERCRRGKRHRAKAAEVSIVHCGAPYGYRHIRNTRDAPAPWEIDTAEAKVVRLVYDKYTADGLSIRAIALLLYAIAKIMLGDHQSLPNWPDNRQITVVEFALLARIRHSIVAKPRTSQSD